jgi:hypothetical protein
MMVGMAGLQVLVVRFFFQGARKGESTCIFPRIWWLTSNLQDMYELDLLLRRFCNSMFRRKAQSLKIQHTPNGLRRSSNSSWQAFS